MNRLSVFVLILGLFTIGGLIGCGDDEGPTGPTLNVPHDLVAVEISSNSITLEWVDEDMIGFGYRVERKLGANWTEIADLESDIRTYTDTELAEGSTFEYRVKSYNHNSESSPSVNMAATTLPNTPTGLSAERISGNSIGLAWTDESNVETGYEIHRSLQAGGSYESIATLDADSTEFTDTGLEVRTTYYYKVRAVKNNIQSQWSDVSSAFTTVYTPFPPTNMEVIVMSDTQIRLAWSRQSPNPNGMLVEMSLDGNEDWSVDSIAGNITSFIYDDLLSATMYYFRGLAYNDSGSSEYSDIVSGETEPGPPLAPSNLGGSAPDYSQVNLSWTDNSGDEAGFYVQRKKAELNFWEDSIELAVDATTWSDEDVLHTTTYDYRVCAYNEYGTSAWTQSVRIIVPVGPPNSPINLVATSAGIQSIRLAWQAGSLNDDGYLIERKNPGDERFRVVNDVRGSQIFLDEGLDPESVYSYRIIAFKEIEGDFLESEPSEPDSAETLSLIAWEDGFEDYALNRPPDHEVYTVDQEGTSTLRVTEDSAHEGEHGIKFVDPGAADGNMARIWINTRPMQKGRIGFWINLAPEGYFGFIGAGPDNIITFQLQLHDDNTFAFRDGGSLSFTGEGYPTGEWAYFEFVFDFETHVYNVFMNGEQKTDDPSVQNNSLTSNSILIMLGFNNTSIDYVFVDELLFEEEVVGEERMVLPAVPMLPAGLHKVSDMNIFNIQHK